MRISDCSSDVCSSDLPYIAPWNNTALDNAIFGGTAGSVTLDAPITVHNLTFNTAGYTLDGSTLTLAGVDPTIAANSGTPTINSVIAGTAGLTKTGHGILHLTGANTFRGGLRSEGPRGGKEWDRKGKTRG